MMPPRPRSTLFPYTTLFRSELRVRDDLAGDRGDRVVVAEHGALDLPEAFHRPFDQRLARSEEHTSELQSHSDLVCRLLLEKKNKYSQRPQRLPRQAHRTQQ